MIRLKKQAPDFTITFDGGARDNGSWDSECYGSFVIESKRAKNPVDVSSRIQFQGGLTNNEAEYETLIRALHRLEELIIQAGDRPEDKTVVVYGDSRLVVNQVKGAWKVKAWNLVERWTTCRELVQDFQEVRLLWKPRKEIEAVLGH